jgi:hypothetical protein
MVRTTSGQLVEVQVSELSDALSREVSALKSELMSIRDEKEKELRSVRKSYLINRPPETVHDNICAVYRTPIKVSMPRQSIAPTTIYAHLRNRNSLYRIY